MGGLTSSALDLARFGRMVLDEGRSDGHGFLRPETVAAATSIQATNHPGLDQGYGLGLKVRTWRGRRVVGHDGNMPGVATQLLLAPDDGVGVVVLTNGYALGVPHQIAAIALEHLLGLPAEPAMAAASSTADATSLGRRAAGTYRLVDAAPPGVVGVLSDRFLRVRVTHEVDGRLRLDGSVGSDGPVWLLPDGAPGRYRVAANVDDGTSAVLEERADGTHLWFGHTNHLHRR
jgi:CubicO group peptidase (beta-lactamase class C family)